MWHNFLYINKYSDQGTKSQGKEIFLDDYYAEVRLLKRNRRLKTLEIP